MWLVDSSAFASDSDQPVHTWSQAMEWEAESIKRKCRTDPCNSDPIELTIVILCPFFFYSHWNRRFLRLPILTLLLIPSHVNQPLECHSSQEWKGWTSFHSPFRMVVFFNLLYSNHSNHSHSLHSDSRRDQTIYSILSINFFYHECPLSSEGGQLLDVANLCLSNEHCNWFLFSSG